MRLEHDKSYVEAVADGAKLTVISGKLGGRRRRRVKTLASAGAARKALRQLAEKNMAAGFVEINASHVRKELAGFYQEPAKGYSAEYYASKLAQLERFESYGPNLRKLVDRKVDVGQKRASFRYHYASHTFQAADKAYWQRTDASDLPNVGALAPFGGEYFLTNDAMANPTRKPKKGPPVDFEDARALLEGVRKGGICEDCVQVMLATIEMRSGAYDRALRRLRPLASNFPSVGSLIGCIHYMRGDLDRAEQRFQRSSSPENLGFVAEKRGEFDQAAEHYLDAAESGLSTPRDYAKARLRLLSARHGRKWLNAKKKAREFKRNEGKILLTHPQEFYSKFPEIADALRDRLDVRKPRRPMREEKIADIRLATLRHGGGEGVPLTEAMKTILRYDRNFTLYAGTGPLFAPVIRSRRRPVPSVDVESLVRRWLDRDEPVFRAIAKLPKRVPVWNDDPELPACIALDRPGDQEIFIYVCEPDEMGEYPIARYDDQPEIWISEASLIHHVLRAAEDVVHCTFNFDKALKKAQRRNAAHREGWSTHPEVQTLISQY